MSSASFCCTKSSMLKVMLESGSATPSGSLDAATTSSVESSSAMVGVSGARTCGGGGGCCSEWEELGRERTECAPLLTLAASLEGTLGGRNTELAMSA